MPTTLSPAESDVPGAQSRSVEGTPAVVAVVATSEAGDDFEATLRGLADQDYSNLTVMVLDVESPSDPTAIVAEILPSAFVRRVRGAGSFGQACHDVLGSVEGATFLLFVHDDALLATDATHAMVTEAFRSNAGIVGAKLVDWDRPDTLRSMGSNIDKFGFPAPVVELGDLDQGQHDAVGDVFFVSSAAMLVRADLFTDLGGFSTDIPGPGEDLDLCWRAWVAGARTVVMSAAVVRHGERSGLADPDVEQERKSTRHEARVMFACYSWSHLLRIVPQAIVFSLFDLLVSLLSGRFRRCGDIVSAWGWNTAHLTKTLALHHRVAKSRRSRDSEIRRLQVRGSARLATALRNARAAGGQRIPAAFSAARDLPGNLQGGAGATGLVLAVVLMALMVIGSRQLLTSGLPVVREFLPIRSLGSLVDEWWSGWRSTGAGSDGAAPVMLPLVGLGGLFTFGSVGLLRTFIYLIGLPLGVLGAWRFLVGATAPRTRVAMTLAYLAIALPYDAIAEGRFQSLVAYAVAPWLIARLCRTSGVEPFDDDRSAVGNGLRLGLLIAVAACFAPVVWLLGLGCTVVIAACLAIGRRATGARRVLVCGSVGSATACLLLLPTTLDILSRSDRWTALMGSLSQPVRGTFSEVVRSTTGSSPGGFLWFAVPVIALVVLFVGRGWRLRWASVAWSLVLTAWSIVILSFAWWPDSPRPALGVMLAPGAVGLAFAASLTVEAIAVDVVGGSFGWRQAWVAIVAVAAALAVIPVLLVMAGGRWGMAGDGDLVAAMSTLAHRGAPNERTLWLGDPDVLPMRGIEVGPDVALGLTDGVSPSLSHLQPAAAGRPERALVATVQAALAGGSGRLGSAVSPFGIRNVVVVKSPTAGGAPDVPPALDSVRVMLAEQLDLDEIDIAPGLDVYRNLVPVPIRASTIPGSSKPLDAPGADGKVPDTTAALRGGDPPTNFAGKLLPDRDLRVAMPDPGSWVLEVADQTVHPERSAGWPQHYRIRKGGKATLRHAQQSSHLLIIVIQLLILVAVVLAVRPRRTRSGSL